MENQYMTKENIEYLQRHALKVEKVMWKACYKYSRDKLIPLSRIEFVIEECNEHFGYLKSLGEFRWQIGISKIFFDNKYIRKYDRQLMSVLSHEFIHLYVNMCHNIETKYKLNNKIISRFMNYSADSSPIFCAYSLWFNWHTGLNIQQNNYLDICFERCDCFDLDESKPFIKFEVQIQKLIYKIENWIEEITKEIEIETEEITMICFDDNNSWTSQIAKTYHSINNRIISIKTIKLGMIDLFEDKKVFN